MKFSEIAVLLPCHSLEDFPVHREGAEADGLLAAWTALWHPALLATTERLPAWHRADGPPAQVAGKLLVIPKASEPLLLAGWPARAKSEGACVVRKAQARHEIVALALAELDGGPFEIDAELLADFYALGLGFLLVELLTRQMRYMSSVDEIHLRNRALDAARAALAQDAAQARACLTECFEVLTEARERFYPVRAYLVDLTLTAETTLGQRLQYELADPTPRNVLLTGALLRRMAAEQPATLAALRQALADGRVSLVGGDENELETPLVPAEATLANLQRGRATFNEILGRAPVAYGRRRFGNCPLLPLVLGRCGFLGAVHATLDDGQFPTSEQSKTRWEGTGSAQIDCLGRLPIDANKPESLLGFPRKMGESMDLDHVATLLFAHWPGQTSPYYEDLRRMARFGAPLGTFITLDEYFQSTDRARGQNNFRPDQYRAPYLKQQVIRGTVDPLSHCVQEYRATAARRAANALQALAATVLPTATTTSQEQALAPGGQEPNLAQAVSTFASALPRAVQPSGPPGILVCNSLGFSRQQLVELPPGFALPEIASGVTAVQEDASGRWAVVETPAFGFTWVGPGRETPAVAARSRNKQAETDDLSIANEHVVVRVSPKTGGLAGLYSTKHRGNLLSQLLSLRSPGPPPEPGQLWRDPDELAEYAEMVADEVAVEVRGPARSAIRSRGRLTDASGADVAHFEQRVEVQHGSPVVRLSGRLQPLVALRSDPWNSYFGLRWAWAAETATLYRDVQGTLQETTAKRIEAPLCVQLRDDRHSVALLCGGLPYHRRSGPRMLDTLALVRGEDVLDFCVGLGVNLRHPVPEAWGLLEPATAAANHAAPLPGARTGWLLHVDARNVHVTACEPLSRDNPAAGLLLRVQETSGVTGRVQIRVCRPLASARAVDFQGRTLVELPLDNDRVILELAAHEWAAVELAWR